ncbi:MAG: FadR family transcriptional regulator [Deltaproteobacteria bacterium]|nr:MAG: FadR family transcriptional regulator [Deltaproteobacteria bacterium]
MFREASQNRIFQDVVNQVQNAILDGRLKHGDVLPPERDLKEMFNTSRGTLREALRVLEERGLIEIRLGVRGGSIVKPLTTRHASQTLALLIRSQMVSLKQLCEFREGVEGTVASLAAQRADSSDKERLNVLLQKSCELVEQEKVDRDAFIESDRKIHLELANISRNSIYIFVLHSVHDNIHQYFHNFLSMKKPEFIENYKDLRNIVEAVERGLADNARILAQSHEIKFYRNMKKREELARSKP